MNRIERLQDAHPFLSEEQARTLCVVAYEIANRPDLVGDSDWTIDELMDEAVRQYSSLSSHGMKDLIARLEEFTPCS